MNATDWSRFTLLAAVLLAAAPQAAADFTICPAPTNLLPDLEAADQRAAPDAPVTVDADQGHYDLGSQTYTFTGDVVLERSGQRLQADQMRYHEPSNRADVEGNVHFSQGEAALTATDGYLYLDEDRGALYDVDFQLGPTAHGSAREARLRSESTSEYEDVRYTVCPPGEEDWWLSSRELELDREEGFGTARHATLRFFKVPVLYTPYISFPIDDRRKTGVLPPSLGYRSRNGLDLAVPYYLNLAPNYDVTLTPRLLSQRGLMLETEARLLRPSYSTELDFSYLPDDSQFGDDRWQLGWDLRSQWQNNAYFIGEYNRVSDYHYLDDFGNDLATTSEQHLLSQAITGYRTGGWHLRGLVQSWQTLDEEILPRNRPYRVLPRVTADYRSINDGLINYGFTGDVARFTHPVDEKPTGLRADFLMRSDLRHEQLAYFINPGIALSHTRYELDRQGSPDGTSFDRSLPLFSLDSGLFLERDTGFAGRRLLQTLEPRLFYLYVPYRDQDELPVFDTSRAELTLAQLFELNRFTGPDRIGDANRLALAVHTRLLDQETGRELLRVGVGRAYYFEERRVSLSPHRQLEEDRRAVSDWLGDLRANIGPLTLYGDLRYDTQEDEIVRRALRLSYRPSEWQAIHLTYRHRSPLLENGEPLEQTELSAVWPISTRWLGLAGWHYSLSDRLTLQRFIGLAYSSCCWTLRSVVREHVTSVSDDPSLSFMVQLEFTGMGALGKRLDTFIEEALSGYRFER